MKEKEEIIRSLNSITDEDREDFEYIKSCIDRILEKDKIDEDSVKEMEGVMYTMLTLRERHYHQLITWLKQGHQL